MIVNRVPEIHVNMNTHIYCDIQVMTARIGRIGKASGSRPMEKQHQREKIRAEMNGTQCITEIGHYNIYMQYNRHMNKGIDIKKVRTLKGT